MKAIVEVAIPLCPVRVSTMSSAKRWAATRGAAGVGLGEHGLSSLFHGALQDASRGSATDRYVGESRRGEVEPSGKRQVVLEHLRDGGTVTPADPTQGHVERIALADGDGRRLGAEQRRGGDGEEQGEKDRESHERDGDKSADGFQRCPIARSRRVGAEGSHPDGKFPCARKGFPDG